MMLSKKMIPLILCAMVLVSSCIVVTTNAEAKKISNWSAPVALQLAGNYVNASDPVVDMNDQGDAVIAWTTYDTSSGSDVLSVSAVTYTDGVWGPMRTISTVGTESTCPEVALNDHGDALVVWQAHDASGYYLQATSFIGGVWGEAKNVSTPVSEIRQYSIAFNDNGNGSLVWHSIESKESNHIMAAIYAEGAWSSAQTISDTFSDNEYPVMALSPITGDVVAVWEQYRSGEDMLAAAVCSGGVWGAPQNITSSGYSYYHPSVAMTADGVALVACEQFDGSNSEILMIEYFSDDDLWHPAHVYTDDRSLYNPAVMMDESGDELVVGWMVDSDPYNYMNATVYVNGAWTPITEISFGANDAYNLRLDTNNYGEAVALWSENDGTTYFVCASIFSNGGWMGAQYVTEGDLDMPRVAMGGDGCAIAVWYTMDPDSSLNSVYYSIYVPPTAPVVITSPFDGSEIDESSVRVEWTAMNIDHYTVSVNGAQPTNVGQSTFVVLSDLDDGPYNVNVTGYNRAGSSSYAEVDFVVDTTAPEVTITNPEVDAWYNTTTMNVTWTASDAGTGIANMSVSLDDGAFEDVATSYKEFTSLADGHHSVFVRVYDMAGNYRTVGRAFNIDTVLPVLNITDPKNNTLINSTSVQVVWTGSSDSPIGRYWIGLDDGALVDVGQSTSYTLTDLGQGEHKVTLQARDYAGNWNTTSVNFTIDSVAPVIDITSPDDGTHSTERNFTVEWTVSDEGSGLDSVEINIDGGAWSAAAGNSYALNDLADGTHTVAIRATDVAGNVGVETVEIVVDNTAPTASIAPSGTSVAIDTTVVVSFSEAMNQTSVTIVVEGVTGTISWNGNVATFTPSADLAYNTAYTVSVSGKDLAGNTMTAEASFTTVKNECTISGVIKDADGNPVANATVSLSNGMSTTTDSNGRFELTGVPSGTYTLTVTKDGFKTLTQTVNAVAGGSIALETMSMAKAASESGDSSSDGTMWLIGIVGVVVVAILGIAFVMYRKKKA